MSSSSHKEDGIRRQRHPDLVGMPRVVGPQAPDGADVFGGQGRQEHADIGDLLCHLVAAQDVAPNDAGLLRLPDVRGPLRQDRVPVVRAAVLGQEPDQSLSMSSEHMGC